MSAKLLQRIDNLDVFCLDLERMLTFYRDDLGLDLLYPYEPGADWFAIQSGDVSIYFLSVGSDAAPTQFPPGDASGISSFSFSVADLDEAIASLDGKVNWSGNIETWSHPNGTWYRFRFFTDPEGNNMSVTEPHKVDPAA